MKEINIVNKANDKNEEPIISVIKSKHYAYYKDNKKYPKYLLLNNEAYDDLMQNNWTPHYLDIYGNKFMKMDICISNRDKYLLEVK